MHTARKSVIIKGPYIGVSKIVSNCTYIQTNRILLVELDYARITHDHPNYYDTYPIFSLLFHTSMSTTHVGKEAKTLKVNKLSEPAAIEFS